METSPITSPSGQQTCQHICLLCFFEERTGHVVGVVEVVDVVELVDVVHVVQSVHVGVQKTSSEVGLIPPWTGRIVQWFSFDNRATCDASPLLEIILSSFQLNLSDRQIFV